MFTLLILVALVGVIGGAIVWYLGTDSRHTGAQGLGITGIIVGLVCLVIAFNTAGGKLAIQQFFASGATGNWLVIDNSGGETMRHWVLQNGYCESSSQSDGWQFYDANNNLCYVSGDAFVMRIGQDLNAFYKTYKSEYNIPEEQEALH